jgi:hypothetical protein
LMASVMMLFNWRHPGNFTAMSEAGAGCEPDNLEMNDGRACPDERSWVEQK